MKRFVILSLLVLTFAGCSTDSVEVQNLNPPNWIQGKWEYMESDFSPTYTFTRDNIISKVSVLHTEDLNFNIKQAQDEFLEVIVQEDVTEDHYYVVVNIAGDVEYYLFNKVDETHIENNGWIYEKIN